MLTSQILRAAKVRIDTLDKWWGGDGCGSECTEQALRFAQGMLTGWSDAHRAFCRAAGLPDEFAPVAVFDWNDSHTHSEVMAAFDRAIEIAEALEAEHACDPEPIAA